MIQLCSESDMVGFTKGLVVSGLSNVRLHDCHFEAGIPVEASGIRSFKATKSRFYGTEVGVHLDKVETVSISKCDFVVGDTPPPRRSLRSKFWRVLSNSASIITIAGLL